MNQDLSISKYSPEFTFKNYNVRINSDNNNSLFTITNERGTKKVSLLDGDDKETTIQGTIIGKAILGEYIVLFTTGDRIYRLEPINDFNYKTPKLRVKVLFHGNLNFSEEHLIETLAVFETEDIQKVYWVDGINQLRFINIVSDDPFNNRSFDFSRELNGKWDIEVIKNASGGSFHSGVIQYAITLWNKNGIETPVIESTKILPVSSFYKGGSPEETVSTSFDIYVRFEEGAEDVFDFLRVYSIQRTSEDTLPYSRIVSDIPLTNAANKNQNGIDYNYKINDNGIQGSLFPVESIPFLGGEHVIGGTIAQKDNTLFVGDVDIQTHEDSVLGDLKDIQESLLSQPLLPTEIERYTSLDIKQEKSKVSMGGYWYYPYTLKDGGYKHWKKGETYRFGIQLQYKNGKWSDVLYLGDDITANLSYSVDYVSENPSVTTIPSTINLTTNAFELSIDNTSNLYNQLRSLGVLKVRPVYVPLSYNNRKIVAQGFVTGTIGSLGNREANAPYTYTDYFTRPNREFTRDWDNSLDYLIQPVTTPFASLNYMTSLFVNGPNFLVANSSLSSRNNMSSTHRHMYSSTRSTYYSEIKGTPVISLWSSVVDSSQDYKWTWFIDKNTLNFWSPEVLYGRLDSFDWESISTMRYRAVANLTDGRSVYTDLAEDTSNNNYNRTDDSANVGWIYRFERPLWNILPGLDLSNFISIPSWQIFSDKRYSVSGEDIVEYSYKKYSRFLTSNYTKSLSSPVDVGINTPKIITREGSGFNNYVGNKGSHVYNNKVNEIIQEGVDSTVTISYDSNNHLVFQLKPYGSTTDPSNLAEFSQTGVDSVELDTKFGRYRTPLFNPSLLGGTYNSLSREFGGDTGFSYLWVVDLVRDIENQYGGKTIHDISNNTWIPCGESVKLEATTGNPLILSYNQGDTYLQRFDCVRTLPPSGDINAYWQQASDGVSIWMESFINLDGRYDSNRYTTDLKNVSFENYGANNPVYSQKDNFFQSNILNYELLSDTKLRSSFLWSEPKVYGELIDRWTNIQAVNMHDVEGNYGPINKLINFNNTLLGFQDKGIFEILYNNRVQVNTSDGEPIELQQSWKTQGIRYISKNNGTLNKWTIKESGRGLYWMDQLNKTINMLGEGIVNLSEQTGFKSWSLNNISSEKDFTTQVDLINNDVYFINNKHALGFSERLGAFESFFSYEDIKYMFNNYGEWFSIKDNNIYLNKRGSYNRMFGENKPTTIEFYLNPDPAFDKVFDNYEYRSDVIDSNGVYLAGKTFSTAEAFNEYQYGSSILSTNMSSFKNKKFRTWSFPFPRQKGTMNRIRNPWTKLRFTFDNNSYNGKLLFHDLLITYNI